jgi:hypothetical protein
VNVTSTAPAANGHDNPPASDRASVRWAYEMRPIAGAADREVAAALVGARGQWLSSRGLAAPAAAAAFRDAHAEAVGLYEDGDGDEVLVGCLLLYRQPDLRRWGGEDCESGLMVSLAHTAPGRDDRAGWPMTMWLSDHAARQRMSWVYAEAPGWHLSSDGSVGRLLGHLRDHGWEVLGSGRGPDGQRMARLRLAAATSPGLGVLIHCVVPLGTAGGTAEETTQR